MNPRLRTRLVRLPLAVIAIVAAGWGPHLAWLARAKRTAKLVIVDKTVPFRNYREHAALTWLFHALKIALPVGRYYQEGRDYIGYDPVQRRGRELTAAALDHADGLFIMDTYGVYQGDYLRPGDIAALERSPEIYGGLSQPEADAVAAYARRGGLTVAEFNAFASPTDPAPRATMEALFGLRWTKWVARYWEDLGNDDEVPQWLRRDYVHRYGSELEHHGSALVFVREDEDIVVLRPGIDLRPDILLIKRTTDADAKWPAGARYVYWLDVVEPAGGRVMYDYDVAVTEAGARALAAHGLPTHFPALVHGERNAWYFAGDFIDTATELGDPERAGLLTWRRVTRGEIGADGSVLWGFYFPLLEALLEPALAVHR